MIKCIRTALLILLALPILPRMAAAQDLDRKLVDEMLDCTMHEAGGPWVDPELRGNGLLRFNYLHEPSRVKSDTTDDHFQSANNLYAAFWNQATTKGDFLHFTLRKDGEQTRLTISNAGWISLPQGRLNFEIFQGGEWTRDQYLIRAKKLANSSVQIARIRDIRHTDAVCDSLAHPVPHKK